MVINDLLSKATHVRMLAVSQAGSFWVVMIAELRECFQNVNF